MSAKEKLQHSTLRFILVDIAWDFIYWPIWWYTNGAKRVGQLCFEQILLQYQQLALGVWLKNIFVPMFGQYDWQGRIISFFIRIIQILARTVLLIIWALIILALFIGYLVLPVYIAIQIIYNLNWLT